MQTIRNKAITPPVPPKPSVVAQLEDVELWVPVPVRQPRWCSIACNNRDELMDCIVLVHGVDGLHAFVFLFGCQTSLVGGWLRLSPTTVHLSPSLLKYGLM